MSVKKGSTEIASIKKGENEIGQAYLGDVLVYDHDRPVWMIRTSLHWFISQDGLTFSKVEDSKNWYWRCPVLTSNGFGFCVPNSSITSSSKITMRYYDVAKLRDNTFSFTTATVASGYSDAWAVASNGSNLIVMTSGSSDREGLYYSTNGGTTWTRINNSNYTKEGIRYIGGNEFFIQQDIRTGAYLVFKGSTNSVVQRSLDISIVGGGARRVEDMWVCNDGTIYYNVSTNSTDHTGTYIGTKTALTQKVTFQSGVNKYTYLGYVTYIYGKYYAILNSFDNGEPGKWQTGNDKSLFVSTDGKYFTRTTNYFPGNVRQMEKNNGRLQVLGVNFFGYIDENEQLHYTSFTWDSTDWNQNTDPTAGFICNKFHKF